MADFGFTIPGVAVIETGILAEIDVIDAETPGITFSFSILQMERYIQMMVGGQAYVIGHSMYSRLSHQESPL